jgi:O-6-methylguanine DNA methyltransferase
MLNEGPFRRRVLMAVRRIPIGRVSTYGDIARLAGKPRAARAVGNIMRDCRANDVPCHRVISAGGAIGGYSDLLVKRGLLRAEGLVVTSTRVKDFARKRWPGTPTRR